jgi:DNA-binding beta-propeller fold protein YncE
MRWLIIFALCATALPAYAEIAISANDGKQVLVDGVQTVPDNPAPDSVSIIELSGPAPRIVATVPVPTSVIGPPGSVAIAPDASFALVTAARRISPDDPHQIVPDDLVSVIMLAGARPRVTAQLHAGAGASGVAIDPAGTMALVANRAEGTVSVFAISKGMLTKTATIALGPPAVAPAQPVFFDHGRRALVTRDGDHRISILAIEDGIVRLLPETLSAGLRPYEISTAGDGRYAVVANIGGQGRDVDTLCLIDLSGERPRVIDIAAVGLTPEGVRMAPDGRHIAVALNDGSNAKPGSAQYRDKGRVQIWTIADDKLRFVTDAPAGGWGQGVIWSHDGRRVYSQAMIEKRLESFAFDGKRLTPGPSLAMPAGPAGIAVAAQ